MPRPLLFLELNEINFEHVLHYAGAGRLPAFAQIIERNGYSRTVSERRYEELEPWIQWVTAHTGKPFAEHGVYRLGDIVHHDFEQIWERLEAAGLKVGAVSPMNAKNRLRRAAFFLPDPWTSTDVSGPPLLARLHGALAQAVNDNAQAKLSASSLWALLRGLAQYSRPSNYSQYLSLVAGSVAGPWRRAMVLDLLLCDLFVREVARTRPDFASLFLNAGAHIQHHYMFSAASYAGALRNPPWYLRSGVDPVFEIYRLYDRLLAQVRAAFPDHRVMIATGLHQDPHDHVTFYWRLRDHAHFLRSIGVPFERVDPRMSRDFLVACGSTERAEKAAASLRSATAEGVPLFEVDNRGTDLFVMLTYPKDVTASLGFDVMGKPAGRLKEHVAFVALKNGHHNGIGYFVDSGVSAAERSADFPLTELPARVIAALLGAGEASRAAA